LINSINENISGEANKYKKPITEGMFMNTQNLQRTLRRAVFKHFFEDASKN